jgi:pyruvate dehydrogenase E2 component (dihydrolipoamide acetyltransferase)
MTDPVPEPTEILIPKLGLTMTEATITQWLVATGARFARGIAVAVIETDKITSDIEAPGDGVLLEILAEPGSVLPPGAAIGRWSLDDGPRVSEEAQTTPLKEAKEPHRSIELQPDPVEVPLGGTSPLATTTSRPVATPYARRLAREQGIDVGSVRGTGPGSRIQSRDIRGSLPAGDRSARDPRARTSALRLELPTDIDKLTDLRSRLAQESGSEPLPVLTFIVYAATRILRRNADPASGRAQGAIHARDISVAIMDGFGLEVRAFLDTCDRLSLGEIAQSLAERSNENAKRLNEPAAVPLAICDGGEQGPQRVDTWLPPNTALMIHAGPTELVCVPDSVGDPRFASRVRLALLGDLAVYRPDALKEFILQLSASLTNPLRMLL